MKNYYINCHIDMVTRYEIIADSEEQARETAERLSRRDGIRKAAMGGRKVEVRNGARLTAKDSARRKREAVCEFVRKYMAAADKDELCSIAFRRQAPNWLEYVGDIETEPWRDSFFRAISDCTEPRTRLYDRYARFAARLRVRYCYGRKSPYECDVKGLSKEQRKQAVMEALRVLDTCQHDQIVIRYRDHQTESESNYWNLFVCLNEFRDGEDADRYYYAWQYVKNDGEDIDDFDTHYFDTPQELIKDLFYVPQYDDDCPCQNMTDIWVD